MTMTSRSSSRCGDRVKLLWAVLALLPLFLVSGPKARAGDWEAFGSAEQLVAKHNPWSGFQSKDAVLMVLRVERRTGESCAAWANALASETPGPLLSTKPTVDGWALGWKHWEPWSDDDRESVSDCRKYPCGVKVNALEGQLLSARAEAQRFQTFLEIVKERGVRYLKTGERKEYEFPGDPVDPWRELEKVGVKALLPLPKEPALFAKRVEFIKGQLHVIHQVVDFRSARSASGLEASAWQRDVYTDHYFDGWGELGQVKCGADGKSPLLMQALVLEFDLLKKTDIVSVISRGNMKSAIEKHGKIYLDDWFQRVQKRVH